MGTSNSCLPTCLNTQKRSYRHLSSLKLTYNHPELLKYNPININEASEDELLLLPGVTRQTAQNILQYRHMNDGFKEIKEISQVSGISSDVYQRIYCDISIDSLSNQSHKLININLASYNELCSIPGLTPALVSKILRHREAKGLFSFIEDLLKIKGINYTILATIRPHVIVDEQQTLNQNNNNNNTNSIEPNLLETPPPELELSSSNKNIFRFASWNLQQLTNDKVQNLGVREVICRVILENKFSLIGIQDIGSKESLDHIIQELNNPIIPSIKDSHHGKWKCVISDGISQLFQRSEYLGFIYDESIGLELKNSSLLSLETYFTRSPYVTTFRVFDKIELVFVNIHLKPNRLDEDETEETKDEGESLEMLTQMMKESIEQNHVVMFGDFNIEPKATQFAALIKCNYSYVIQQNTDISLKTPEGSTCTDNIWLSSEAKELSTGDSGVVRDNLTSKWIPADGTLDGLVSDHCPIWIDFNIS